MSRENQIDADKQAFEILFQAAMSVSIYSDPATWEILMHAGQYLSERELYISRRRKVMKEMIEVIESEREFLAGSESVADVAQEWIDACIPVGDAIAYAEARTFTASAARRLMDAGIIADQAAQRIAVCGYTDTIGYAVSNGDLSITAALRALR